MITVEGLKTLAEAMGYKELSINYVGTVLYGNLRGFRHKFQPHKSAEQCNECEEWALRFAYIELRFSEQFGWSCWLTCAGHCDTTLFCAGDIFGGGETLLEAKTACFIRLAERLKERVMSKSREANH